MCLTNSQILYTPVNSVNAIGCLKLMYFSKNLGRLSSTGSEILTFSIHCSAFQTILDCFIPKFKLKYDNLENIKTDRVNTVVSTCLKSNSQSFLGDTRYRLPRTTLFELICRVYAANRFSKHRLGRTRAVWNFPGCMGIYRPALNQSNFLIPGLYELVM